MSADTEINIDRRLEKTRTAIVAAFLELLFDRPYGQVTIAAIVERANVGRSTFYEHFTGKDDLLRRGLSGPLSVIASTVRRGTRPADLVDTLKHFRENQRIARVLLQTAARHSFSRVLAAEIETALGDLRPMSRLPVSLVAAQIGAALQAAMEPWILSQVPATAETLAEALCLTGRAMAEGLLTY